MTTTTMYAYEARLANGSWSVQAAGQQDRSNYIATREQAEAGLPALAASLGCSLDDVRVVALRLDVPPKTIKITLSERRPVTINVAEWPVIAEATVHDGAVASQANTEWAIRVREHRDGRRIVYGYEQAGGGGKFAGWRETRAGYIVDAQDRDSMRQPDDGGPLVSTYPDDDGTIRAIRRVAGVIDRDDLGAECIGELPAEVL